MTDRINFTHHTIWDASGVERVNIEGDFTAEELSHLLIEEWIPYFECHTCGRADYCKYTQPHKYNPDKLDDIKCGVAVNTIKNLIRHTFA